VLKGAGAAANEANTKALVIEPILSALRWNLYDFNEVDREFKVYDGTFLDYALRIDGKPKLFLEAKALGRSLADKQFIAQTVNYANNEGVVWCVLTNGLVYRVYKSNEPVSMDRKLLFEVDVRDAQEASNRPTVIASLEALARPAVASGSLDSWGETVFTDLRVRQALAHLATELPKSVVAAVAAAVDGPPIADDRLRSSLGRLLGQSAVESPAAALVGGAPPEAGSPKPQAKTPTSSTKKVYSVEHHTGKKPTVILALFQEIDAFALALGPDVERRPTKTYIGYFAGKKSFFTLELQKTKIYAYVSLDAADVKPWGEDELRDVRNIGHFGMGDTEFTVRAPDQLPRLEALLRQAYLRTRK